MKEDKKVLIIEDNLEIQEIYKLSFEAEWFEVELANDWLEWIVELLEKKPDLVILDIMMPTMDWFEVLRTIKNQSEIKTPVIVCSNLSTSDDEKKALLLWADLYLRKSDYDWEEIVKKSKELLEKLEIMR